MSATPTRGRLPMRTPGCRRVAGKYRILALAATLVGAVVFILTWVPYFGAHRAATESETVFAYFAERLGEARLCQKISWAAFQRYSVLFGGGGASYARSDCYEAVAVRNHDRAVCWNVRPLVDIDPLSAGYSALSCRRRVTQGGGSPVSLAPEKLVRAFDVLGYDVDTLHLEGVIGPAIRPADVYRELERKPGMVDRVAQALARPDAALSADDKNFLAQFAAVTAGDARWCERIPAAAALATEAIPFRDWCYLTVAFDTWDTRICQRMTPAAAEAKVMQAKAHGVRPEIAEQFSARADCARIDKWVGPRPHYGPEVPPDPQQIQRLIAALGLDMPRARDWPAYKIAGYCARFLDALQADRPGDLQHRAARAKLISQINARSEFP